MLKKAKNSKKFILGIAIIFLVIYIAINTYQILYSKKLKQNLKDITWVKKQINISLNNDLGTNIYNVSNKKKISIYNQNYQKAIDEKINELLEDTYTINNPLIILNPYGTNNLGANIYFNSEEALEVSYTVSVSDKNITNFSRTLNNDAENNYTTKHSYQIIGLVPEKLNTIKLIAKNKNNDETTYTFTINMSNIKCESDTLLESVEGDSNQQLEDGLFVLFGLDKAFNANNYLYDNNGIIRADLVLHEYRSDRIIFYDDKLIYSYDTNKIAVINRLGKVEKEYTLKGYTMHHDYIFDEENKKLLILANSNKESSTTIEDLIISLDLKTGKVQEIVDMKDLMPDIYNTAKMPESGKNTYGGTGLDWIHLNSLSLVNNNGDIVISSRELSTIIYLENIYKEPSIKYLIADPSVYKNTKYENLVLEKIGDFINQAGQHTITYVKDDNLEDGQYYLEMYNNNYGASNTREEFPWKNYTGVGTFSEGTASKYYQYLVDEKEKSYKLTKEFDVEYSSIVSSVQDLKNNHVTSSGKSNSYAEYDEEGSLIRQFNYTSKKYAYRVFKYNFENIWFK